MSLELRVIVVTTHDRGSDGAASSSGTVTGKVLVYSLVDGFPFRHALGVDSEDEAARSEAGPGHLLNPMSVCFAPWNRSTVLVAEQDGDRIQELDVDVPRFSKIRFEGVVSQPFGLAATVDKVVVVDSCPGELSMIHRISALRVSDGTVLWRQACGDSESAPLVLPRGLRVFTNAGGEFVVVADYGKDCLSLWRGSDGSFVRDVTPSMGSIQKPRDVEVVDGGFLVTCGAPNRLVKLGGDGGCEVLCTDGASQGQLSAPWALSLLSDGLVVVREDGTGGRFQVMGTAAH